MKAQITFAISKLEFLEPQQVSSIAVPLYHKISMFQTGANPPPLILERIWHSGRDTADKVANMSKK